MLGKLIKNELNSTWKVPTALCSYLVLITLVQCISLMLPIWDSDNNIINTLLGGSMIIYILSLFGVTVAAFAYFVLRFYRNMYTDEGYLMHTLPVKPSHHIFSKGIAFSGWMVICSIVLIISMICVFLCAGVFQANLSLSTIWDALVKVIFPQYMELYHREFTAPLWASILLFVFTVLIQGLAGLLHIYASISIGQLFQKHRVLASFIAYVCINIAIDLVETLCISPILIGNMIDGFTTAQDTFFSMFIISLIVNSVVSVAAYIATELIMRKKLNLE